MGSTEVSPVEIVDIAAKDDEDDDDDVVLVLHAKPISSKTGENAKNAISVEQYSEDRDLQLAIMASLSYQNRKKRTVIDLSVFDDDDDVQVLESPPSLHRKPFRGRSITETGESSNSKSDPVSFICQICFEPKPYGESFQIKGCAHSYCSECMNKYVASKLQENISQIECPVSDCKGLLEPEHCRSILPSEVFDRWGNVLCEAVILGSEKFYCPFKDCSALLINDNGGDGVIVTQSECPYCRRFFCAQCKVPWHTGIECAEFQKLNKDEREIEDIMLMQLAKNNKWIRCPMCKFYVEKS